MQIEQINLRDKLDRARLSFDTQLAEVLVGRPDVGYAQEFEETHRLSIDFGQMKQFNEIHSPFTRLRLGNERLRTRKQFGYVRLGQSCIQSGTSSVCDRNAFA